MKPKITICMGSSCFARGNARNLELIESYLERREISDKVELCGSRCEGHCRKGPNLAIDGEMHHGVDASLLMALLSEKIERP